jgi:hypothetical protein
VPCPVLLLQHAHCIEAFGRLLGARPELAAPTVGSVFSAMASLPLEGSGQVRVCFRLILKIYQWYQQCCPWLRCAAPLSYQAALCRLSLPVGNLVIRPFECSDQTVSTCRPEHEHGDLHMHVQLPPPPRMTKEWRYGFEARLALANSVVNLIKVRHLFPPCILFLVAKQ